MTRKLSRPAKVNETPLSAPAETFLKQGKYLHNWSDRTVRTYRQGLVCLGDSPLTKTGLEMWVVSMRERGLTPGGCNMYIRTVKAFMGWLVEEGHLPSRLKLKLLKAPLREPTLLSTEDIKKLVRFKPKGRVEARTQTLILLLLDTGLRIDEALSAERKRVNLDEMTLVVRGKGDKDRIVPFSAELRKVRKWGRRRPT